MLLKYNISLIIILIFFGYIALAQDKSSNSDFLANIVNGNHYFIENKGQIVSMEDNSPVPSILFKTKGNSSDIYITNHGISYVFYKIETPDPEKKEDLFNSRYSDLKGEWERIDMNLINSNPNPEIIKYDESNYYENYYLAHCPGGILNLKGYKKILIKEIYPNIDWIIYYNENNQLKYDFIVHPNGNPNNIKIKYNWADKPVINSDKSITIKGPLGEIIEGKPLVLQGNKIINSSWQILPDNSLGLNISNYNKQEELVIDPILLWATYTGGSASDPGYSIKSDGSSVFVAGMTSSVNFPTYDPLTGAYFQGTLSGGNGDCFIIKFNTSGVRQWATYYGGTGDDTRQTISINTNSIYMTGQTMSDNFPTLDPGTGAFYQATNTFSTASDIYIVEFDKSGNRIWSTYFGGGFFDAGYSINCNDNFLYISLVTASTDMPIYNPGGGAFIQNTFGGATDYYLLKMTAGGVPIWGTYYGGTGDEAVFETFFEFNGDAYLIGGSQSTDYPVLDAGGSSFFQGTKAGQTDIVISKFNSSCVRTWSTYLGGTGDETARTFGINNNQFFLGAYSTSTDIPVVNPGGTSYNQTYISNGRPDGFIAEFNTNNEYLWGTHYGGSDNDYITGIHADNTSLWISGRTLSNNITFPLLNPGMGTFFQGVKGASYDAFFAKFKINGTLQWSTYYGGNSSEESMSIFSDNTNVWVAGRSNSSNLFTLPVSGAYNQATNGGGEDAMILKFDACIKPNVIITPSTTIICLNDTSTLVASGALSYEWLAPNTFNDTLQVSPAVDSTYTVIGTDDMNCTNSSNITITVNPLPQLIITQPDSICFGDSITLHITSDLPAYYLWSVIPPETDSTIVVTPDTLNHTFNYFVLVTDTVYGCKNIAATSVYTNSLPTLSISPPDSICFGDSITLTVHSDLPSYYLWDVGNGSDSILIVSPDTVNQNFIYNVLVTDTVNGCKSTASTSVFVNALPQLIITSPDSICFKDSITLVVNCDLPSIYFWTPGNSSDSTLTVSPLSISDTTIFSVLVTDTINGCFNRASTSIFVNPLPQLTITPPDSICNGDTITLNIQSDLPSYYLWSPGNGNDSTQNSYSVHPDIAYQTYIYSLIATDTVNGCKNYDTTSIYVHGKPDLYISNFPINQAICFYDSITFTTNSNDSIYISSYQWNPNLGSTSSIVFYPSQADSIYLFTVIGTSVYQCKDTASTFVIVHPNISVNITSSDADTAICYRENIILTAEGENINTYLWSPATPDSSNSSINIVPNTNITYSVLVTSPENCIARDTIDVTVYPLPIFDVNDTTICYGNSVNIGIFNPFNLSATYTWIPGNLSGNNVIVSPLDTTTYTITSLDSNSCQYSMPLTVNVDSLPIAAITGIDTICYGLSTVLQASGGTSYLWIPSQETSPTITISPLSTSTYVLIANSTICYDTTSLLITVNPKPIITATSDTTLIIGMSVPLNVIGANSYVWSPIDDLSCFDCASPIAKPYTTIEYCVIGTNTYGCLDTTCVTVTIDAECGEVFVPSAFSPNGDNQNDILYVYGKCVKSMDFKIFNRWGEKVFETTDPTIGWDGSFRGKDADTDVFVYFLKAEYYIGTTVERKGNITLMH